jgi:hypothetical protein
MAKSGYSKSTVMKNFPMQNFPDEILQEIFLRLTPDNLCKTIVHVCKRWRNIVENEHFWIRKSIQDKKLNDRIFKILHANNIFNAKYLYFKNPFYNLIKNPCGEEGFKYWCLDDRFDSVKKIHRHEVEFYNENFQRRNNQNEIPHYWLIESNPSGSKQLPGKNKVFTTSYNKAVKYQIIDLDSNNEIIAKIEPKIRIFENYAARFDCGSSYKLVVKLLDKNYEKIDEFIYEDTIQQWNDGEWMSIEHVFEKTSNVRYISYGHTGKDTQFWAGYYGIKISNSSVQILF